MTVRTCPACHGLGFLAEDGAPGGETIPKDGRILDPGFKPDPRCGGHGVLRMNRSTKAWEAPA